MTARALTAADEAAFQRLLRAVYGDAYSYRDLYAPGGLARLLASGKVLAFGDFDDEGELFSHTAFLLKDPKGDYVESGMSLRDPRRRTAGRMKDAEIWAWLLAAARERAVYVHQNTTTWHPLAQRYAERHMFARPTGIIGDYTIGERLLGLPSPETPMQALTMTSLLRPEAVPLGREAMLPEGPFSDWLAEIFERWGRRVVSIDPGEKGSDFGFVAFEQNPWIGLRRRVLIAGGEALAADRPRTDLVHLPVDERVAALPALIAAEYLPVGTRPHASRPDEVVLQHLPAARREGVLGALRRAELYGGEARGLVEGWIERCARIS